MAEPSFIHLRVHSDYSMVDGLNKVNVLVKKVASMQMPALAITDFTNLCGLIKFYCSAYEAGIKPIIGVDCLVNLGEEVAELTILAATNVGYHNLIWLISETYQLGYSNIGPIMPRDLLIKYNEGLILLSGGRKGDVGKYLLRHHTHKVEQCLEFYRKYFPDRYYLELIRTGRPEEETYLNAAVELAMCKGLPVVATNDVRFISSDDFDIHEIRVAIHDGYTIDDVKRPRNYSPQQYMRTEKEMCELFKDIPEALVNSVQIARRCNVTIRLGEYFLPTFPTGEMSIEDFLVNRSREGLDDRLKVLFPNAEDRSNKRQPYDERLATELKVINNMGFPGYFLIVMEFVQWSKDNGVPVGPGRGSGAGSLVAYALKITEIDPLIFDLLFERFLNSERISMPDIDIDFCMEKRDLVINHVAETYGRDAVSQIITFGSMTAKAVIRDVGRVLGYPYSFVDPISKLVPFDPGITLEQAVDTEPRLQAIYTADEEVRTLINKARKLEGVIRNVGKHAGGVVIAPTKITNFTPIYCDVKGQYPVTQFDKKDVECVGLVKFDFLGLRTLTIINWALEMINNRRALQGLDYIDIATIPLVDKKSFEMLQRSETTAVFQLESRGMKDLIKRLQPDCFEDMIALLALFRPGPLQSGMVDNFINRKQGREAIAYPDRQWQHELLKPVLAPTYGIILYQEQVMQIAQVLAGYTLGEADILRRAMGQKNPIEMANQRSIFKTRSKSIGIDGVLSMKIFDLVEKFAGYGFNKSHSVAYAMISYQTLWLKAHYPAEFMAATLTADMANLDKVVTLINECWRMGLKILPPNINIGKYRFHVNEKGEIIYGIGAIKGVGEGSIEEIIEARKHNGHFMELFELCARTEKLNRRMLEKLIMSGALDCLGLHRAALMHSLDHVMKAAEQHTKAESLGQRDLFGVLLSDQSIKDDRYINVQPWPTQVILEGERETLGLYLTNHPIRPYLREIEYYSGGIKLNDLSQQTDCSKIFIAAGWVISVRIMITKRGHRMGICTLEDLSGRIDVMLFTDVLAKYQHLLEKDRILIFRGQVTSDGKMTARELIDLTEVRKKYVCGISIHINDRQINNDFLKFIRLYLEQHRFGTIPVHIYYQREDVRVRLNCSVTWRVILTENLLNDLRTLIGHEQVQLEFYKNNIH